MQHPNFTYDELTPLEQCIAEFMARQESKSQTREHTRTRKKMKPE